MKSSGIFKLGLVFCVTVFSAELFARTPVIGDFVEYNVISTSLSNFEPPAKTDIYTEKAEFIGHRNSRWIIRVTQTGDRNRQYTSSRLTDEVVARTPNEYLNCLANGGTEEVITVPAGTFEACHQTLKNSRGSNDTWYAKDLSADGRLNLVVKWETYFEKVSNDPSYPIYYFTDIQELTAYKQN
jgi:hypothetical protein